MKFQYGMCFYFSTNVFTVQGLPIFAEPVPEYSILLEIYKVGFVISFSDSSLQMYRNAADLY